MFSLHATGCRPTPSMAPRRLNWDTTVTFARRPGACNRIHRRPAVGPFGRRCKAPPRGATGAPAPPHAAGRGARHPIWGAPPPSCLAANDRRQPLARPRSRLSPAVPAGGGTRCHAVPPAVVEPPPAPHTTPAGGATARRLPLPQRPGRRCHGARPILFFSRSQHCQQPHRSGGGGRSEGRPAVRATRHPEPGNGRPTPPRPPRRGRGCGSPGAPAASFRPSTHEGGRRLRGGGLLRPWRVREQP